MSCLRPKKGFWIGYTEKGKKKYKITSYLADHVEYNGEYWTAVECENVTQGNIAVKEWLPIPCGKCYACRLQYAKTWTLRLMLEKTKFPDDLCWFITLTYNPEELPYTPSANTLGEVVTKPTLRPKDMQLFFKRLRKEQPKLRIFYCGEYGSRSGRPHYHAIVFGLKLDDLKVHGIGKNGDPLYISKTIDDAWYRIDDDGIKHSLGYCDVGRVTARSCAYVARYCMKKSLGKNQDPYVVPEFIRMSRRPGIASEFVDQAKPVMLIEGQEYFIPRYFRKKLEEKDPDLARQYDEIVKELGETAQKNLERISEYVPTASGYKAQRYLDYLANKEYTDSSKVKVRSDL